MMAIVNRTRDSFYDQGATYDDGPAQERVDRVVEEGAEIVDIGGVRAGYGEQVDAAEEIRRVVPVRRVGARAASRRGHQRGHLALGGRARGVRGRRRPAQRRLGRARPAAGGGGGGVRRGHHLHAHRRAAAADRPLPDRVRRRGRRGDRGDDRARRASPGGRGGARVDRHRPGPRLRQEHLPLPGGDPASRRDGRHGLAGARLPVQQGLRRRDARRSRPSNASRARWPRRRCAPSPEPGSTGSTRCPRPGRRSTWCGRSPAGVRRCGRSGASSEGRTRARRARAAARVRRPGGPGARGAGRGPGGRGLAGGGRSGHGGRGRAGLPRRAAPPGGCRRG